MSAPVNSDTRPNLRGPLVTGAGLVALFFGLFGGWAVLAQLQSAAIAPGIVSVESQRKTVQHLEGGIVADLAVREGDEVALGQVLLRLDRTQAESQAAFIRTRYRAALALEARLIAERDGAAAISYPAELELDAASADIAELLASQTEIRRSREELIVGRGRILEQGIAEYEEELRGLDGQIAALAQQTDSLEEERAGLAELAGKGLVPRTELREVERRLAEVEADRSAVAGRSAQLKQSITESRLKINELDASQLTEVVEQLRDVQGEILELREQLRAAEDVLARTDIRAPIAGKVVGLNVHTTGGVIAPGAPLLDIVPADDTLVVEARLDPADIDVVHVGQSAQVRLTALNLREAAPVDGTLISISADAFASDQGRAFYLAKVQLDAGSLERALRNRPLMPGMETEVMIVVGERTPLDYFLEPLLRTFNRALRET